MKIYRLYVEKRSKHAREGNNLCRDLREQLEIQSLTGVRVIQRYDVTGISETTWTRARETVFSEPQVDVSYPELRLNPIEACAFGIEYLPGQFDQRADSAEQCLRILDPGCEPRVAHARILVLTGNLSSVEIQRVKKYCINPVDSREASLDARTDMEDRAHRVEPVQVIHGFTGMNPAALADWLEEQGLAMSIADLEFCREYFRDTEKRDPTEAEIRVLDTYWSDHCRHTTFHTRLDSIEWNTLPETHPVRSAYARYRSIRETVYGDREPERPITLMDLATIGMKYLRSIGRLDDLEVSEEINAASIEVPVQFDDGSEEQWLVMFKNETHNHPTEIEPFGGAATCLGGAIRDPLSGRSYVYQAMRVTGSGDPREPFSETLPGKLPQRVITTGAADGYSSYGNQIGLATGMVHEIYHPGYVAKRMEIGAVIAAAPREHVIRGNPTPGDRILLVGGKTGRDGIGGATGSSKQHTDTALENTAEVQKGNPPVERALQRLFRDVRAARLIKRCNDFGAGGVSVAIGEIAPGLEIDLDRVPTKYQGLNGTDLALSESQERMAVCIDPSDVDAFVRLAAEENLLAVEVARVTDKNRLVLNWQGTPIVDISREFLDTNGVTQSASVSLSEAVSEVNGVEDETDTTTELARWKAALSDLNSCSQQGLTEHFDSTIGVGSVLHPLGGHTQTTPVEAMVALIPSLDKSPETCTLMSWGFDPYRSEENPYLGAAYAVVHSVARLIATGADFDSIRLTFQEYFERLGDNPERWAKPFSALLGALTAQLELGTPAVGGKDSMSGSFNTMDVPPTLVSFAVAAGRAEYIRSPEFKGPGHTVCLLRAAPDAEGQPNWAGLRALFEYVQNRNKEGAILSMATVGVGGLAATLFRMAIGNRIGVQCSIPTELDCFLPDYGALVLECASELPPGDGFSIYPVGTTTENNVIQCNGESLLLQDLLNSWQAPLESVFPTRADVADTAPNRYTWEGNPPTIRPGTTSNRPRVLIPTFPGTNCEWDSARAFRTAGADPQLLLFRNRTREDIEQSLKELESALDEAQILMLPGGFSAGDEPDGSGKFISTVFRNARVADATMRLLRERDGLILGICNGFQALVKLGLLPFGEILTVEPHYPTLTSNSLSRHMSRYVTTRVSSTLSPWLRRCRTGQLHTVPVSHGEGRFVADSSLIRSLAENGQIATQYVDPEGQVSNHASVNPNGSVDCIEGITSADGRIFGKMAHSERCGKHIGKNIPGDKIQPIFQAGVDYFRG